MLNYELDTKTRALMATNETVTKAALATIANQEFDNPSEAPEGIFKTGGGIRVNYREVSIKGYYVVDSGAGNVHEVKPEEEATVRAIIKVANLYRTQGAEVVKEQYGECRIGDPLRSFSEGP